MASADLVLDSDIRNWAMLPVAFVMLLIGVLRHYIAKYFDSTSDPVLEKLVENHALLRCRRLRANGDVLLPESFARKKAFFVSDPNGIFFQAREERKKNPVEANPLSNMDPTQMSGMMRKQFETIIVNMAQMGWVTTFFSGMVLVKLPFGMPDRFRAMTQRGIELTALDVRYVSSLSWYILNAIGLRAAIMLVLGEDSAAGDAHMMQMQAMGQPEGMGQPDIIQVISGESEALEMTPSSKEKHESFFASIERKLVPAGVRVR